MSFDTKITMTWASADDQNNPAIHQDRMVLLDTMKNEGKTDGTFVAVSPVITERFFIDVPAAEEWQAGLTTICSNHSVPAPGFVIG